MEKKNKCACPACNCLVNPSKAVVRQGKTYCSATCANECTASTCICVHDDCGCETSDSQHKHP